MHSRRLFVLPVMTLVLAWSAAALAIAPSFDAGDFEIPLPEQQLIDQPAQHFAVIDVQELLAQRYGGEWHVNQWNQYTRTPESIYGSGVDLAPGGLPDDQTAGATAFGFIAANEDLLRVDNDDLAVDRVVRGMGKVAVHFAQDFHGVPVIGGRARLLFTEAGRLYALGSSFYGDIDVNPVAVLSARQAESIAQEGVPFDPSRDTMDGAATLLVLPVPLAEGGADYHLVWRMRVVTSEPYGIWVTHVDAHDGSVVYRYNDVHSLYSGTDEGDIDNHTYCIGSDMLPIRDMDVDVTGIGTTVTDANGEFSLVGSGGSRAIHAEFDGPEQNVQNQQGGDAMYDETIDENVPHAIVWTDANSHAAERDCFYWVNEANAWIVSIDAAYAHPKYTCNVNVNSTCNANWGGNTMNFFREGGGCGNTGTIGDVMCHEFGHGVQSDLIGSQGSQGLGEGNGDILGSMFVNDSVIGRGFYLNDCSGGIRDCDNNLQYPGDVVGQPIHSAGRVICGFNWDTWHALEASMGQQAGFDHCAYIWHFGRKLWTPTNQPDQVLSYFLADDDDGNLENGTPHHTEICFGATEHGFECPEILVGVIIVHSPLPSTTDHTNPYTVEANVYTTIEGASIIETSLFYQVDGGGFVEVAMTPQGGDDYAADIPAQADDGSIEYYIYGRDSEANERTSPASAPAALHQFYVATVIDEMEAASGWTAGVPGDNATTGVWERVDPIGTAAQPENDHTPAPGTDCFVTGQCSGPNCPGGCSLGCNDVDGGRTTLLSPVYDLAHATEDARVAYWRWYSNNTGGAPNADFWVVDVSNDGGSSWTSVENVNPPSGNQGQWVTVQIDLIALFGAPDQVQLRFIASDESTGSLVEAAVDDLIILTGSGTVAVESAATPDAAGRFVLHEPRPNPFNPSTEISYETPAAGHVQVAVYDAAGRLVRMLVDRTLAGGAHRETWDGRDDGGRTLASGVYHVRMTADGAGATQKMVLLK